MFYYFGYGSNMNPVALAAKGVSALSAEPAKLKGWELCFNIPDFFQIEGGTGNIQAQAEGLVHGVLYACPANDLAKLDALEAVGVNYRRVRLMVETYSGRSVSAYVYCGLSDKLRDGFQPSRRYLNILLKGAESVGLDADYVQALRGIEVKSEPVEQAFLFPEQPRDIFSLDDLKQQKNLTALAGAVFDLSQARPDHLYLQRFMAGKDMTLFFLKRMDGSTGAETEADIRENRLCEAQKRYLNAYLHEFDREYRYIGRMDYAVDLRGAGAPRRMRSVDRPRRPSSARAVLEEAERLNQLLGHENLGFLSRSHGFVPKQLPKQQLPKAFAAWDQLMSELPMHYRNLTLRHAIQDLPLLDAGEDALGDAFLLRAAAVLAMLSHAHAYVETGVDRSVPEVLAKPWETVRRRLGRELEVLSYIDLIIYNFKLKDETLADPFRVENMQLLMPTVGNQEEQVFYLTQLEILARCSPVIGAVARAQDAVQGEDWDSLAHELLLIQSCLEEAILESLPKINPNPASHTHVDAVTWAKTVAPFAVPLKSGVQGPSGTSSPIFNLLDAFFGRTRHDTFLGKEILGLRGLYPHFWREFLTAVSATSVGDAVRLRNDPHLTTLYRETLGLYSGENGFLGRHKTKVFGYLETAFKVGRSVTIGGFAGLFKDRTWEQVDSELEYARLERLETFPTRCHQARIQSVGQTHQAGSELVKHVVLDVRGCGLRYRPGDRCGILPENADSLIEDVLRHLKAQGDERIRLTEEWRQALALRQPLPEDGCLDLRSFLRFAKLRPVLPRVAEALHALTQNGDVQEALKEQTCARWEFSDLLDRLGENGFDPSLLWRSPFHSPYALARVLPPEQFRMYSISSAHNPNEDAREIHLTVGRLRYSEDERERHGTASNFLASGQGRSQAISFILDRPPRFGLPKDRMRPIIMIGGGTGFAPFRSFLADRLDEAQGESGAQWLLLSLKDREHFYYQHDLIPGLAKGRLKLDVVFSQDDVRPQFVPSSANQGSFRFDEAPRAHIQDLLLENAAELWRQLKDPSEGGEGACLYICGRTRFARNILDSLKLAFAQFFEGSLEFRLQEAQSHLDKVAASGRFMQEVFTHARSWRSDRARYDVSQIVERNTLANGYWMVIDAVVYDFTDFMGMHPGGASILHHSCGMDATQGFMKVHKGHSEIEAMRDMYEIGVVRQLDFKGQARELQLKGGVKSLVGVSAVYRKWVNTLYLCVEMENALRLDQSLQIKPSTMNEPAELRTFYKAQRSIETHQRFFFSYALEMGGNAFADIWELSAAVQGQRTDLPFYLEKEGPYSELTDALQQLLAEARGFGPESLRAAGLYQNCHRLEQLDLALLQNIKAALRDGVRLFETYEDLVLERGGAALLDALRTIPYAFERYRLGCAQLLSELRPEAQPRDSSEPLRPLSESPSHCLYADSYWIFEEKPEARLCVLRRLPRGIDSIAELMASNERIIDRFESRFATLGLIVDMRDVPQRNDRDFEDAMRRLRLHISMSFARVAVLLESARGELQVHRIGRDDGSEAFATFSEYAAETFARGPAPAPGETGSHSA